MIKKYSYSTTAVPVEKSKQKIRDLLIGAGVRGVQFSEDFSTGAINVRFAKDIEGNMRTVSVTMKIPEVPESHCKQTTVRRWNRYAGRTITYSPKNKKEQMERATYRALHYWLKSQFEAVDFGLLRFEDVFLSHFEWIIKGETRTVGELVLPHLSNGSNFLPAPQDEIIEGKVRVQS